MLTNNQLKTYLEFFEGENNRFYEFENGYVNYHEKINDFISDCYQSNMMDTDYLINLQQYIDKNIQPSDLIETVDIDLLKTILTYYIRGERFCEGMIADSFKDHVFKRILIRLIHLQDKK